MSISSAAFCLASALAADLLAARLEGAAEASEVSVNITRAVTERAEHSSGSEREGRCGTQLSQTASEVVAVRSRQQALHSLLSAVRSRQQALHSF